MLTFVSKFMVYNKHLLYTNNVMINFMSEVMVLTWAFIKDKFRYSKLCQKSWFYRNRQITLC